jgi:hypothetical protein
LHILQPAPSSSITTAIGDLPHRVREFGRKVNAHNASHFTAVNGNEHEGLLRYEPEHGGQGRDQDAGAVEMKIGRLRCRHGLNLSTGTVGLWPPLGSSVTPWG